MGNSSGPAGQQRYRPKHPMIAGAITGGIEICLTYPLEYAKCQLQLAELARGPAAHGAGRAAGSAGAGSAGASLLGVVRDTVRARGPLGLYSGLSPWLFFSFPRAAFRFAVYEEATAIYDSHFGGQGGTAPTHVAMLAGVAAGVVEATTCMTPMHCIQIKTQQDALSGQRRFHGLVHAVRSIVRTEGVRQGLYAGLGPTVLKQAVNSCIRFTTMNELTSLRRSSRGGGAAKDTAPLPIAETFFLGACAGALSAVVSHPIDTVKSNMQGNSQHASQFQGSSLRCFYMVYQAAGIRGLYWGILPRMLRVTAEQAVTFSMFDLVARQLDILPLP